MTIKELRDKTGMSQSQFAKATGIPKGTIQHWEQGIRTPGKYMESLIEKALRYDGFITGEKK